jgi:hypothetical protein
MKTIGRLHLAFWYQDVIPTVAEGSWPMKGIK